MAKTLEAEKLKLELARLKRQAFGQSSERIAREIAQLELKLEEIEKAAFTLTPGRYVGAAVVAEEEGAFEERMTDLVTQLREDFAENERLTAEVRKALQAVGYEL